MCFYIYGFLEHIFFNHLMAHLVKYNKVGRQNVYTRYNSLAPQMIQIVGKLPSSEGQQSFSAI